MNKFDCLEITKIDGINHYALAPITAVLAKHPNTLRNKIKKFAKKKNNRWWLSEELLKNTTVNVEMSIIEALKMSGYTESVYPGSEMGNTNFEEGVK